MKNKKYRDFKRISGLLDGTGDRKKSVKVAVLVPPELVPAEPSGEQDADGD